MKIFYFPELKEECTKIRNNVLENLKEYVKIVKDNLEKNDFFVYIIKDQKEAEKVLSEVVEGNIILKSKTNVGEEIKLKEILEGKEVIETDFGDFVSSLIKRRTHPILPLYGISEREIYEALSKEFNTKVTNEKEAVDVFRNFIFEKILKTNVGVTGANAVSCEGSVFIVENEGNVGLVSRLKKHIVITSIEKINPTDVDCLRICEIQSLFSLGRKPSYINVITGPSKTGDIPNKVVKGVQGSKETHILLIDNGRLKLLESDFKEILKCINCGACLYGCPAFNVLLDKYGFEQKGMRGILLQIFQKSYEDLFNKVYYCTGCGYCKEICPAGIDIPKLVKKLRNLLKNKGYETDVNKEMIENIKKFGNPIEETEKGLKMFCC